MSAPAKRPRSWRCALALSGHGLVRSNRTSLANIASATSGIITPTFASLREKFRLDPTVSLEDGLSGFGNGSRPNPSHRICLTSQCRAQSQKDDARPCAVVSSAVCSGSLARRERNRRGRPLRRKGRLGSIKTKWLDLEFIDVEYRDKVMRFAATGSSSKKRARTLFSKEPITLAWIDTFADGDTVYDIGANVGMYTIYAAADEKCEGLCV